jgi:transposase
MPSQPSTTIGVDTGDRYSHLCLLDTKTGEVVEEARIPTNPVAFEKRFAGSAPTRIAIEVGTHSPWISRLLEGCGHQVLVANARKLRLIYGEGRKTDRLDAQNLARLARLDPKLLSPMRHREETSQAHLALIRSRDALIRSRTQLVNHVRGAVKSFGARLPKCSAASFHKRTAGRLPEELAPALEPILETIADLTARIREYDRGIETIARELYPETRLLKQVPGVGTLTALAFVLTVENPSRFGDSRAVGAYLGLVPGRDQSGDSDPQRHISKRGDRMLRRLLVGSAHYLLGPFGEDSDLRRHGEKLAARGGKNAKKRAVVAVARKLSVLLHRLWVTGETYDPLRNAGLPRGGRLQGA